MHKAGCPRFVFLNLGLGVDVSFGGKLHPLFDRIVRQR
jgi:hypothetical protein